MGGDILGDDAAKERHGKYNVLESIDKGRDHQSVNERSCIDKLLKNPDGSAKQTLRGYAAAAGELAVDTVTGHIRSVGDAVGSLARGFIKDQDKQFGECMTKHDRAPAAPKP